MKHLPLGIVLLPFLFLGPYMAVQTFPGSVTQTGAFVSTGPPGVGYIAWTVTEFSYGPFGYRRLFTPGGLNLLFHASFFADEFYFRPIAFAYYKASGRNTYKFL